MNKFVTILLGISIVLGLLAATACSSESTTVPSPAASSSSAAASASVNPASSTSPPAGTPKTLEFDTPPSSVEVNTGDQFVVYIESNPSTGYSWQIAPGMDENVVKLSSQEKIPAPAQSSGPPIVGAPGKQKFTFTAVAGGQTTITLNYLRPWEKDVAPVKTQVISVTVK